MKKIVIWLLALCMVFALTGAMAVDLEEECAHSQELKYEKPATCKEAGYKEWICESCGEPLGTEPIEKLPHTPVVDAAVAATCSSNGLTEGSHCDVCGDVIVPQEPTDTLNHTEEVIPAEAATCTATGLTEGKKCTVCGEVTVPQEVVDALGHTEESIPATEVSCTASGWTEGKRCSVCSEVLVLREEIAKIPHEFSVERSGVDATCTAKGYYFLDCSYGCGHFEIVDIDLGHTVVVDPAVAATCTATGLTVGSHCSVCGEILVAQEETEKIAHTEETDHKDATCTEPGYDRTYCTVCKQVISDEDIAIVDHQYGEWEETEAPKCEVPGKKERVCSVCGDVDEEEIEALEHVLGEWQGDAPTCVNSGFMYQLCTVCWHLVDSDWFPATGEHTYHEVVTPATATKDGEILKVCEVCGYQEEEVLHNWVVDPAVEPTCTETGLTEGKSCSACGWVDIPQEVVEASGHDIVIDEAVEATCAAPGLTEGERCITCGEILLAQEEIEQLPHTPAITPAVEPTCSTVGWTVGSHCSVCEEVIDAPTEVAKLPHTEEAIPAVAATCAATGLTEGKKCSVCGEITVAQEETEKLPHTEEIIPAVAATCTETGLTEGKKCSVCGEITVAQEETEKLPHTEEIIPAVEATCLETGLTEGKKCTVCGEITVAQEEVAALGHTEEIIPAVEATCTETGLTEGKKCTVCGEITVAQEEVAALGHTEEIIPAVEATCLETGLTEGKKCTVCGEITVAQEEVAALGHAWQLAGLTKTDCTRNGAFHYVCEACGERYKKTIYSAISEEDILEIVAENGVTELVIDLEMYNELVKNNVKRIHFIVEDVTVCIPLEAIAVDAETSVKITVVEGLLGVYTVKGDEVKDITLFAAEDGVLIEE